MLVILDLDETLVFSTKTELDREYDFEVAPYFVYVRPHLRQLLDYCFNTFDVAVWTSSTEDYADGIVTSIFPDTSALKFVWSRRRCTLKFQPEMYEWQYVKDLRKAKRRGFDLKQVLMVDNTPAKLARHYGNLIRMSDFIGDPTDRELIRLQRYLNDLKDCPNVRTVEKRGWQTRYSAE